MGVTTPPKLPSVFHSRRGKWACTDPGDHPRAVGTSGSGLGLLWRWDDAKATSSQVLPSPQAGNRLPVQLPHLQEAIRLGEGVGMPGPARGPGQ